MLCIAHFYDPQMVLSAHTPRRLRLPQSPASCLLLPLRLLPPLHADSQMGFGEYRPNSRREEESKREREKDATPLALMCQTEVGIGIGL